MPKSRSKEHEAVRRRYTKDVNDGYLHGPRPPAFVVKRSANASTDRDKKISADMQNKIEDARSYVQRATRMYDFAVSRYNDSLCWSSHWKDEELTRKLLRRVELAAVHLRRSNELLSKYVAL